MSSAVTPSTALRPMSLIPSSRMTWVSPGVASTSRSNRASALGPAPKVSTRPPEIPAFDDGLRRLGVAQQPRGEDVRPPRVGVARRARAVGDRVAERDDHPRHRRVDHVHADEVRPDLECRVRREGARAGRRCRGRRSWSAARAAWRVERRDESARWRLTARSRRAGTARATGSLSTTAPGSMRTDGPSAEGERAIGGRHDRRPRVADRDVRGADDERPVAVLVREPDAHPVAADRRPHDEAQRLIEQPRHAVHGIARGPRGRRRTGSRSTSRASAAPWAEGPGSRGWSRRRARGGSEEGDACVRSIDRGDGWRRL